MDNIQRKINVIFEDSDILVVDKPAGLTVNRSVTAKDTTLQDLLDESYEIAPPEPDDEGDYKERSGIVHRLDKDTSGVMVVAKHKESFDNLISQFKERRAVKEYVAVLCGSIEDEIIEVNAPIKRNPKSPLKYAVVEGGKESLTKFEKIGVKEIDGITYTVMKVLPKTGRTHQIRVHASAMGHPVAGDVIYCSKMLLETSLKHFGRMMLHAHRLGFFHPKTDNFIDFQSDLPPEFSL